MTCWAQFIFMRGPRGKKAKDNNWNNLWIFMFNAKTLHNLHPKVHFDCWWCRFVVCWMAEITSGMDWKWKLALAHPASPSKSIQEARGGKWKIEDDTKRLHLSELEQLNYAHSTVYDNDSGVISLWLQWAWSSLTWANYQSQPTVSVCLVLMFVQIRQAVASDITECAGILQTRDDQSRPGWTDVRLERFQCSYCVFTCRNIWAI